MSPIENIVSGFTSFLDFHNAEARVYQTNVTYIGKSLYYRPEYVIAFHELMHIEETTKGLDRSLYWNELLPSLKELLLNDQIAKEICGIPLTEESTYSLKVKIGSRFVNYGEIAHFYRSLEEKYGSLIEAVLSPESKDFCTE